MEQSVGVMGNSWGEILTAEAALKWLFFSSIYLKAKKQSSLRGHIFSTAQGISHEILIKDNDTCYYNF